MLLSLRSLWEAVTTTVTVFLTGVTASAAIGAGTFNVGTPLPSVSASAAVGVGSFNADFSSSGVVAGANVGVARFNASFTTSGVAADPEIGTGTVEIQSLVTYPRPISEGWPHQRLTRVKPDRYVFIPPPPPLPIVVEAQGVKAFPNVRNARKIRVNATTAPIQSPPLTIYSPTGLINSSVMMRGEYAAPTIGTGKVKRVIDLTDEEIITLMEAA